MKKPYRHFIGLLTAALIVFIGLFVNSCSDPVPFPTQLVGNWVTDTAKYEDRYIEIDETKLIFGTGKPEPNILFINSFEKKPQGKTTEWIFHCEIKKGERFKIVLLYYIENGSESIQLKNTPQIFWYKEE